MRRTRTFVLGQLGGRQRRLNGEHVARQKGEAARRGPILEKMSFSIDRAFHYFDYTLNIFFQIFLKATTLHSGGIRSHDP
jgi:hypothetical protein